MRLWALAASLFALGFGGGWPPAHAQSPPTRPTITVGDPGPKGTRIDKDGVFANFFPASGGRRAPAILLIGGSEGGLQPGNGGMVKGFTDAGFSVLYLCYFGCPGTPPDLGLVPLETFDRALALLRTLLGVDPKRIAVAGGSKGGEAALLVATRHPELKAVIAAVPSSVVWPGSSPSTFTKSSWTVEGRPLPFLPYAFGSYSKGGIFGLYKDALPNLDQHQDAAIPVERISARVLLVCGTADKLWPSCAMSDEVAERLNARARPAANVLRYQDAGHGAFGPPFEKADDYAALAPLGGTTAGNAAARADGWPKVIAFLKVVLAR